MSDFNLFKKKYKREYTALHKDPSCSLHSSVIPFLFLECDRAVFFLQDLSQNLESSTIQKQRRELQLLIAELKDRDKELNDMVVVHQRQLLAWEDDRQKILTLAERCSLLESKCRAE